MYKTVKDFLKDKNIWIGSQIADMSAPEKYFKLSSLIEEYHQVTINTTDKIDVDFSPVDCLYKTCKLGEDICCECKNNEDCKAETIIKKIGYGTAAATFTEKWVAIKSYNLALKKQL